VGEFTVRRSIVIGIIAAATVVATVFGISSAQAAQPSNAGVNTVVTNSGPDFADFPGS
jgi:hypothetical protein